MTLEAAAAGLPLVVTPLYGVEEFMRDGETGFVVPRTAEGVRAGLERFLVLPPQERARMGRVAQEAVQRFDVPTFVQAWRDLYLYAS